MDSEKILQKFNKQWIISNVMSEHTNKARARTAFHKSFSYLENLWTVSAFQVELSKHLGIKNDFGTDKYFSRLKAPKIIWEN